MSNKQSQLSPMSLGAVRKAREALRDKALELLEEYRAMIKAAAASGKYEEALKAQQWLLDHVPADEEGQRVFGPSIDKTQQIEGPKGPVVQLGIGFNLGGLSAPPDIKVIETDTHE